MIVVTTASGTELTRCWSRARVVVPALEIEEGRLDGGSSDVNPDDQIGHVRTARPTAPGSGLVRIESLRLGERYREPLRHDQIRHRITIIADHVRAGQLKIIQQA
jgi:hypothetical protein